MNLSIHIYIIVEDKVKHYFGKIPTSMNVQTVEQGQF